MASGSAMTGIRHSQNFEVHQMRGNRDRQTVSIRGAPGDRIKPSEMFHVEHLAGSRPLDAVQERAPGVHRQAWESTH
jgi:hypothetical protein